MPDPAYETELRDMFAAHAMHAWLRADDGDTKSVEDIAALAYEQADAMIRERRKDKP